MIPFERIEIIILFPEHTQKYTDMSKPYIDLRLFATLSKKSPESGNRYSIEPGMTVKTVLDQLGISPEEARLIFIDGVKKAAETRLYGGERVGVFPPVGGG